MMLRTFSLATALLMVAYTAGLVPAYAIFHDEYRPDAACGNDPDGDPGLPRSPCPGCGDPDQRPPREPCSPADADPDGADVGEGLHLQTALGNIYTKVPVFQAYAMGHVELDFYLRYDSLRSHEDGPLGYGWTHSFDVRATPSGSSWLLLLAGHQVKLTPCVTKCQIITGQDIYNCFEDCSGPFQHPVGWLGEYALGQFTLTTQYGSVYTFDGDGFLSQVRDTRGRRYYFVYQTVSNVKRLQKVISPHGRVVELLYYDPPEYTVQPRLWKVVHPDGEQTVLTYSADWKHLESVTDPAGRVTTYDYFVDAFGRHLLVQETLKTGAIYTANYTDYAIENDSQEELREIRAVIDPSQPATTELVVRAAVKNVRGAFPNAKGVPYRWNSVTVTDGRGNTMDLFRDDRGRIISTWYEDDASPPNPIWWRRHFTSDDDPNGHDDGHVDKIVNELGYTTYYNRTHDPITDIEIIEIEHEVTVGVFESETYTYDTSYGSKSARILESVEDGDGDIWSYTYDPATYDLISVQDPRGAAGTWTYEYYEHPGEPGAATGRRFAAAPDSEHRRH